MSEHKFKIGDHILWLGNEHTIKSLQTSGYTLDDGSFVYESEAVVAPEPNGDLARWEDEGGA